MGICDYGFLQCFVTIWRTFEPSDKKLLLKGINKNIMLTYVFIQGG